MTKLRDLVCPEQAREIRRLKRDNAKLRRAIEAQFVDCAHTPTCRICNTLRTRAGSALRTKGKKR